MAYLGRLFFDVTSEWTWKRIVRRESGAVTVLATEPATPPLKRCLSADTARESSFLGSSSCISFSFVSLRIMLLKR